MESAGEFVPFAAIANEEGKVEKIQLYCVEGFSITWVKNPALVPTELVEYHSWDADEARYGTILRIGSESEIQSFLLTVQVQKSGDQNIQDFEATVKELADKVEKQEETIATLKDEIRAIKRHLQFEVNSTDSQDLESSARFRNEIKGLWFLISATLNTDLAGKTWTILDQTTKDNLDDLIVFFVKFLMENKDSTTEAEMASANLENSEHSQRKRRKIVATALSETERIQYLKKRLIQKLKNQKVKINKNNSSLSC